MSLNRDRVVVVSRVVWDHVVSRGFLDGTRDSAGNIKTDPTTGCRHVDLFSAAQALFPLVALVCKRVLRISIVGYVAPRHFSGRKRFGSYGAIASAAAAEAPSCVAWLINNRRRDVATLVVGCDTLLLAALVGVGLPNSGSARPTSAGDNGCGNDDGSATPTIQQRRGRCEGDVAVAVAVKEVTAALMGLCIGGHLRQAQSMLGSFPALWDGRIITSWMNVALRGSRGDVADGVIAKSTPFNLAVCSVVRERVIENLRGASGIEPSFMARVCGAGQLDVAKWLVSVASITKDEAPWMLRDSLRLALANGKMEVAQYLLDDCIQTLHYRFSQEMLWLCAGGSHPCNIGWCVQRFTQRGGSSQLFMYDLLTNKNTTLDDCMWLEQELHDEPAQSPWWVSTLKRVDVAKWFLTVSRSQPELLLNGMCQSLGDVGFVEWLMTEKSFTPTSATFKAACSTRRKKGATLARWLSTRVSLSRSDFIEALVSALRSRNTEVAEWLDGTFHVMDVVNSDPEVAGNTLVDLCKQHDKECNGDVGGLKWFLHHLSQPSKIGMNCIHSAVRGSLDCHCGNSVMVLLEFFPEFEPNMPELVDFTIEMLREFDLKAFSLLLSRCSSLLTPEFISYCLTSDAAWARSSKAIKWAICKFNLQYSHISANRHQLIRRLLSNKRNQCAHWLLDTFSIPLSDVVAEVKWFHSSPDLIAWQVLQDHYNTPASDAVTVTIRECMIPIVANTPSMLMCAIPKAQWPFMGRGRMASAARLVIEEVYDQARLKIVNRKRVIFFRPNVQPNTDNIVIAITGWLDGPRDSQGNPKAHSDYGCRGVDLFRAAEAMFPLVALACSRVLVYQSNRWPPCHPRSDETYGTLGAITGASCVPAPSCVAWIIRNRHIKMDEPTSSSELMGPGSTHCVAVSVKEVVATLLGLCMGGHISQAQSVLGKFPALWDGRIITSWAKVSNTLKAIVKERVVSFGFQSQGKGLGYLDDLSVNLISELESHRVIENLRGASGPHPTFLARVCGSGCVDAVKWIASVAGITKEEAPWLLHDSLWWSLICGKMELFKFLFDDLCCRNLPESVFLSAYHWCARGLTPSYIKWCRENFPVQPQMENMKYDLLSNKHSTLEDCLWMEEDLHTNGFDHSSLLSATRKVDVAKWVLTVLPSPPADKVLSQLCGHFGDVEFVQWLMTEKSFTPTAATFKAACSTSRKKGSTLAKWLSTRVSLSQSSLNKALVSALRWSNMEVAEWLEGTFHVMDSVNSNPEVAGSTLVDLCKKNDDYKGKVVGLNWLLQHLSQPSKISSVHICRAISDSIENELGNYVPVLLEKFPGFDPQGDPNQRIFRYLVVELVRKFDLKTLELLMSGRTSPLLTPEFVSQFLTADWFQPESSKAVKWAIRKFNLQYIDIKSNNNCLLFNLFSKRKNECARWLLTTFDIPLSDLLQMVEANPLHGPDLAGLQVILDHYGPEIDAAVIRQHFMPVLAYTPDRAIYTSNRFGITLDEFREYAASL
ncbi:hypothetical protein Pelo_9773 [Pelomyxa schiedti]|nr:hypothetical protein Pelo_9773 [Pelomyxa schiedti]